MTDGKTISDILQLHGIDRSVMRQKREDNVKNASNNELIDGKKDDKLNENMLDLDEKLSR